MQKDLILHLGFPKTATTTLQNNIFIGLNTVLYLGKNNRFLQPEKYKQQQWLRDLKTDLITKDIPFFKSLDLYSMLRHHEPNSDFDHHDKIFISEEGIISRCISPSKYGNLRFCASVYNVLDKIKLMTQNSQFSNVKIILVIRRQDAFLESFFAEDYENFKSMGLKSPDELANYIINEGKGTSTESTLHFDRIIQYADNLFGQNNILALPYEQLVDDTQRFLMTINSFSDLHLDINYCVKVLANNNENSRSLKGVGVKVKQAPWANAYLKKLKQLKDRIFGAETSFGLGGFLNNIKRTINKQQPVKYVRLSSNLQKEILQHYSDSNKRLINRLPTIEAYGYI